MFFLYLSSLFSPLEGSNQTPQLNRANMGMEEGEEEDQLAYYGIFRVSLLNLALSWAGLCGLGVSWMTQIRSQVEGGRFNHLLVYQDGV